MQFKLVDDLFESRLFPSKNSMKRLNAEDLANMTFLYLMALQILKSEFSTAKFAHDYIYRTFKYNNFDTIFTSSTDLTWMLYALTHKDVAMLDDNKNNMAELAKININNNVLFNWARTSIKGRGGVELDRRFFIMIEKMLNIRTSNYRSVRALVSDWTNLDEASKQLAMTRLLFAFRKKMQRSEVMVELEKLAEREDLEIRGAHNPEDSSHPTSHGVLGKLVAAGAVGVVIGAGLNAYSKSRKHNESRFDENAAVGATTAGAIASVVQPMAMVRRVKTGTRKKKKGVV